MIIQYVRNISSDAHVHGSRRLEKPSECQRSKPVLLVLFSNIILHWHGQMRDTCGVQRGDIAGYWSRLTMLWYSREDGGYS
jgi:hypothetical protein